MSFSSSNVSSVSTSRPKSQVSSLNLSSAFKSNTTTNTAKNASGLLLLGRKPQQKAQPLAPKPVQLPSYKKESKGFDTSISIVPAGSTTWKTSEVQPPTTNIITSQQQQHSTSSTTPSNTQQQNASSSQQPSSTTSNNTVQSRWSTSAPVLPTPIPYSQRSKQSQRSTEDRDTGRDRDRERDVYDRDRQSDRDRFDDRTRDRRDRVERGRDTQQQTSQSAESLRPSSVTRSTGTTGSHQWGADDDDDFDYSKPVVFADGTVVGAQREREREFQRDQQQKREFVRDREDIRGGRTDDSRYHTNDQRYDDRDRVPRDRDRDREFRDRARARERAIHDSEYPAPSASIQHDRAPRERTRRPSTIDRSPSPSPTRRQLHTHQRRFRQGDEDNEQQLHRKREPHPSERAAHSNDARNYIDDDEHAYLREKAAQRRAEREAEEERRLQAQRRAAAAKLAAIEAKLNKTSNNAANAYDRDRDDNNVPQRERRISERSELLHFGPSSDQQQQSSSLSIREGQKITLMQRPRTSSEYEHQLQQQQQQENDAKIQSPQQQQHDALRKQRPIQLVTKISHPVDDTPIQIVPAPQPDMSLEQQRNRAMKAWKDLPTVQHNQAFLSNRYADNDNENEIHNENHMEQRDRDLLRIGTNQRDSSVNMNLINAAATQFSHSEFDRGESSQQRRRLYSSNNDDVGIQQRAPHQQRGQQSDQQEQGHQARNYNDARRSEFDAKPRRWVTEQSTSAATPSQGTPQGSGTVTEKIMNIMDLPLDSEGRPMIPGLSDILSQQSSKPSRDYGKQRNERTKGGKASESTGEDQSRRGGKRATTAATNVKPITPTSTSALDNEVASINDNTQRAQHQHSQSQRGRRQQPPTGVATSISSSTSTSDRSYVAKKKENGDGADKNDVSIGSDTADYNDDDDAGFEKVLSKREIREQQQKRRDREEQQAKERARLQRQDAYKQQLAANVQKQQSNNRSTTSSPATQLNATAPSPSPSPTPAVTTTSAPAPTQPITSYVGAAKAAVTTSTASSAQPAASTEQSKVPTTDNTASQQQQQHHEQMLKQLQLAYPQLPASQLEEYIESEQRRQQQGGSSVASVPSSILSDSSQRHMKGQSDQSNFMSMFRQSPAPSLSPSFSAADSSPQLRGVLSPSSGNVNSDEYLLHTNEAARREMSIRMLMSQNASQAAQQGSASTSSAFSPLSVNTGAASTTSTGNGSVSAQQSSSPVSIHPMFGGWSDSSKGNTNGGIGTGAFSVGNLPFTSPSNFNQIHTLAQHFGMSANAVAQLAPQQFANLQQKYQAQVAQNPSLATSGNTATSGPPNTNANTSDAFAAYSNQYSTAFSGTQNPLQQQQQRIANLSLNHQQPYTQYAHRHQQQAQPQSHHQQQVSPLSSTSIPQSTTPSTTTSTVGSMNRSPSSTFSEGQSSSLSNANVNATPSATSSVPSGGVRAPLPHTKKSSIMNAFADHANNATSTLPTQTAAQSQAQVQAQGESTVNSGTVPQNSRLHGWIPKSNLNTPTVPTPSIATSQQTPVAATTLPNDRSKGKNVVSVSTTGANSTDDNKSDKRSQQRKARHSNNKKSSNEESNNTALVQDTANEGTQGVAATADSTTKQQQRTRGSASKSGGRGGNNNNKTYRASANKNDAQGPSQSHSGNGNVIQDINRVDDSKEGDNTQRRNGNSKRPSGANSGRGIKTRTSNVNAADKSTEESKVAAKIYKAKTPSISEIPNITSTGTDQ